MPTIGRYTHRVTIEKLTVVHGALGSIETWTPIAKRWVSIHTAGSEARFNYSSVAHSRTTHILAMQTKTEVAVDKYRFIKDNVVYEPTAPIFNPDSLGMEWLIPCAQEYRSKSNE